MSQSSRTISSFPASVFATDDGKMLLVDTSAAAGALNGPPSSGLNSAQQGVWVDVRVKGPNACVFTPAAPHTVEGSADITLPGNSVTRLWHDRANGDWFRADQRT